MAVFKPVSALKRMPAPTPDRYRARNGPNGRFAVEDQHTTSEVDSYRTRAVAESYARALNAGNAKIAPHAIIGCRIQSLLCGHCRDRGCDRCRRSGNAADQRSRQTEISARKCLPASLSKPQMMSRPSKGADRRSRRIHPADACQSGIPGSGHRRAMTSVRRELTVRPGSPDAEGFLRSTETSPRFPHLACRGCPVPFRIGRGRTVSSPKSGNSRPGPGAPPGRGARAPLPRRGGLDDRRDRPTARSRAGDGEGIPV